MIRILHKTVCKRSVPLEMMVDLEIYLLVNGDYKLIGKNTMDLKQWKFIKTHFGNNVELEYVS